MFVKTIIKGAETYYVLCINDKRKGWSSTLINKKLYDLLISNGVKNK